MGMNMKKLLACAVLSAVAFMAAETSSWGFRPPRPFKFDVSFNVAAGDVDIHKCEFEDKYAASSGIYSRLDGRMPVEEMYSDKIKDIEYYGAYSVTFEAHLAKRVSVGGDLMMTFLTGKRYKGFDDSRTEKIASAGFYIMPEVRIYYYSTRVTSMSGSVGGGIGLLQGCARTAVPVFQIKPLTLTVGGKLYGKAELSFGNVFSGVNFGVGYKF